jgi:hypothetical protein
MLIANYPDQYSPQNGIIPKKFYEFVAEAINSKYDYGQELRALWRIYAVWCVGLVNSKFTITVLAEKAQNQLMTLTEDQITTLYGISRELAAGCLRLKKEITLSKNSKYSPSLSPAQELADAALNCSYNRVTQFCIIEAIRCDTKHPLNPFINQKILDFARYFEALQNVAEDVAFVVSSARPLAEIKEDQYRSVISTILATSGINVNLIIPSLPIEKMIQNKDYALLEKILKHPTFESTYKRHENFIQKILQYCTDSEAVTKIMAPFLDSFHIKTISRTTLAYAIIHKQSDFLNTLLNLSSF